jgi:hypothetical protein
MKLTLGFAGASALLLLAAAPAPAEPPPATAGPVDGLVSSPGNFKLLLENDHVRVLQQFRGHQFRGHDTNSGTTQFRGHNTKLGGPGKLTDTPPADAPRAPPGS